MLKKLWITGLSGFIGRHVCLQASEMQFGVYGIGHGTMDEEVKNLLGINECLCADISADSLTALFAISGPPDLIIHLAGGSSVGKAISFPRDDFIKSVDSSSQLLEWVRLNVPGVHIVVASSAAVYGAGHSGLIDESVKQAPFSPYGAHKQMMESLCQSYVTTFGLTVSIARLFSVYGNGLQKQLLWDICTKLKENSSQLNLEGIGSELRDWTHVTDVARVLLSIKPKEGSLSTTLNVGSGIATPVSSIANMVATGWSHPLSNTTKVNFSGNSRKGDPFSLVANPAKLNENALFCSKKLELGIDEYVSWFKSR